LLLQAGCPAESLKVIERGFGAGALGTGAEAEKHNRFLLLAQKKLAEMDITLADRSLAAEKTKDGAALSNLGYGYVTAGKYEEGIKKILDVLKIEGIKFEDDAKLHLGLAYLAAGQKSNAIRTFKTA
jgi:tetratricopeptide (TPR) repeat protein